MVTLKCWKPLVFAAVAACLLAAAACLLPDTAWWNWFGSYSSAKNAASPNQVELPEDTVLVVGSGEVDVDGGVLALSPVAPGKVEEILVREGQRRRRGEPLLRLHRVLAQAQLEQAEANVAQAQLRLALAQLRLPKHQYDLEQQAQAITIAQKRLGIQRLTLVKLEKMRRDNLIGAEDHQAAKEELAALQAVLIVEQLKEKQLRLDDPARTIALAEKELAAAQAGRTVAEQQLANHQLTAPEDGTVLRILVGRGQVLGGPMREPAVWFLPDRPLLVRCEIEQEFAERVAVGQACEVYNDRLDGVRWVGTVMRLAGWMAPRRLVTEDPLSRRDVRTLECLVALESPPASLRIGQRVRVAIRTAVGHPDGCRPSAIGHRPLGR